MILPTLISAAGIAATIYYERWSAPKLESSSRIESVGFVRSVSGLHLRRKDDSQIWEPLQDGDSIFAKDQLKTGNEGELAIAFPSERQRLDLESDSNLSIESHAKGLRLKAEEGYFTMTPMNGKASRTESKKQLEIYDEKNVSFFASSETTSYLKDIGEPLRKIDVSDSKVANYQGLQWIAPIADAELELNPDFPKDHVFTWQGDHAGWNVQLEWGSSRRRLPEKKWVASSEHVLPIILPIGKHFWRWSIVDANSDQVLWSSPTSRVSVKGIFPPAIVGPTGGVQVRVEAPTSPLSFKWIQDQKFDHYKIEIAADESFSLPVAVQSDIKGSEIDLKPGKFGSYFWRISGIEANGNREITTKPHAFKLLPKVVEKIETQWVTRDHSEQNFVGEHPTLNLRWTARPAGNRIYKIEVKPAEGELGQTIVKTVRSTEIAIPLEKPGHFRATMEAVNSDSDIVGVLSPIEVAVQVLPLLKAPVLKSLTPQPTLSGQIAIQWQAIDGAREYQVEVRTPEGRTYIQSPKQNELQLKKLMPGNYDFSVTAIDGHGRSGARSPAGSFLVPEHSGLKAPKIRKVEVQ